jgi:hypothetical protein
MSRSIPTGIEIADHDERQIAVLQCQPDALLKERCLVLPLWEVASEYLDTVFKLDQH